MNQYDDERATCEKCVRVWVVRGNDKKKKKFSFWIQMAEESNEDLDKFLSKIDDIRKATKENIRFDLNWTV